MSWEWFRGPGQEVKRVCNNSLSDRFGESSHTEESVSVASAVEFGVEWVDGVSRTGEWVGVGGWE